MRIVAARALLLGAALLALTGGCRRLWHAAAGAAGAAPAAPAPSSTPPAARAPVAGGLAWTIEPTADGTALIRYQEAQVASFRYVFWGKDWAWTDPAVKPGSRRRNHGFTVEVPHLGVNIERRGTTKGELLFEYTIEAERSLTGVVGGGMEFNLRLDAPVLGGTPPT